MKGKRILGTVIGLISGIVLIMIVEALGHMLFPVDPKIFATLTQPGNENKIMFLIPTGALLFVLLAYMTGSFASGILSVWISGRDTLLPAVICGVVLLILGSINLFSLPHPIWMIVASIASFMPLAYFGGKLMLRKKEA